MAEAALLSGNDEFVFQLYVSAANNAAAEESKWRGVKFVDALLLVAFLPTTVPRPGPFQ